MRTSSQTTSEERACASKQELTVVEYEVPRTLPVQAGVAGRDQGLKAIFEIAKIVVTEREADSMLPKLLHCLIEALEAAETGILEIYDPVEECLAVRSTATRVSSGYEPAILERICLAPGEAMGGTALENGQVQLYPTPEAIAAARENLRPQNRAWLEQAIRGPDDPLSAICIPLITSRSKVGALVLENRSKPDSFRLQDVPFLEAVADLIALSIENVQLREDLQETQALEEANRLKAELISTLAHEMRTPLTSIKGYATAMLMEEATFSPEKGREFLHIIDQECETLQDLIHDLLESSVIDAGLMKLEPQPVMLDHLVRDVIDDIARRAFGAYSDQISKEIGFPGRTRFAVHFPRPFPVVDADPHRIGQVLRNLLDNAIKYSPNGGLIVVRGEAHQDEVVVSVSDQGEGIAPEDLNRLFEKFFRARSGLSRHVVGSGLGLPIARTIIESHGGRIWAESQKGKGSTFYFTLPLIGREGRGSGG
jgi:signal transduction histidine kinase